MDQPLTGLIVKSQGGFFTVRTDQGLVLCKLRGRLKQKRLDTDLAVIGDRVTIRLVSDQTGIIDAISERRRVLARRAPAGRGYRLPFYRDRPLEQVIVANPDQAVFVFACAKPAPHLRMLDRFLVVAEANGIEVVICANKIDLVDRAQAQAAFRLYELLGYPVEYTSARTGEGVEQVRQRLLGKLSVLAGPSGVGKSSLLNTIQPGLGLAVRSVSTATTKGRHVTVHSELIPLEDGGWVADTPGLRALELFDVEPEELDGYFVEIAPRVADCKFSNCKHLHELGCAVIAAVEQGAIHPMRYESYRRIRLGEVEE